MSLSKNQFETQFSNLLGAAIFNIIRELPKLKSEKDILDVARKETKNIASLVTRYVENRVNQ